AQAMSNLILPTLMGNIVDNGVVDGDITYVYQVGLVMLGVTALTVLVAVLASYYTSKVAMAHGRDLRRELCVQLHEFSLKEFDVLYAESLTTRSTNDITQIQLVLMIILRSVLRAPLMIIVSIVMEFSKGANFSFVVL